MQSPPKKQPAAGHSSNTDNLSPADSLSGLIAEMFFELIVTEVAKRQTEKETSLNTHKTAATCE